MKKIHICTLYGNENFGNKLQNYALQRKLEELNFDVRTLRTDEVRNKKFRDLKNLVKYFLPKYHKDIVRYNLFLRFNKKYLKYENNIKKYADYYVIGSDQVWNPNASKYFNLFLGYNLRGKIISYAASFGISSISEEYKEIIAKGLKKFKAISVREDTGKKIVEDLTGLNNIKTLIDPTMLISKEHWEEISQKPKGLKKSKYILCYFLGNVSNNRKQAIKQFAEKNDCFIINILDKNDKFYTVGPNEFLYLEKNAFLICTDSFHSCVFAILFNRPFVVFNREQDKIGNMNSRIDTLLKKFDLDNRIYNGKNITQKNININYKNISLILEKERKSADKYLKQVLDIDVSK